MLAARPTRQHAADLVRVLLIEGDTACAERVRDAFERIDWAYARLDTAASLPEAQARLKLEKFDLVIGDEAPGLRELVLENGAFDLVAKDGLDDAALQRFLRLANAHAAGSVRSLRRREARFRKTFELARCQEALGRFGQAALALREPAELIDEAVRTVTHAVAAREACYISASDPCGASAALVDVLHCGVHYVCDGTCIVPVRREGEVRGALSAQGEGIGVETLPFLDTLASLLSTALQRIDSERKLDFLAQFDPLTGLANRRLLAERLTQMIEQAKSRNLRLAVLFIDLDRFKLVNDSLQPAGGDALLREAALRIQAGGRLDGLAARLNGDRFAVVLPGLASAEDAAGAAQHILERLSQRFVVQGAEIFLTASIGIATCPDDGERAEALIDAADAAMQRAKQAGRDAYRCFAPEFSRGNRARPLLALELRWQHPERGVLAAAQFVPLLEETGLIVPVGEWAIARAIIDMAHTLDFTVVAEGVETVGQMVFLRQFGCEQGQGFLFARPMSAAELSALL